MKDAYYQKLTKKIYKTRKKTESTKDAISRCYGSGIAQALLWARNEYRLMKRSK